MTPREDRAGRVLYLDRKNKLIADEKAGQGTVDHAPVYPREIARPRAGAVGLRRSSWFTTIPAATRRPRAPTST